MEKYMTDDRSQRARAAAEAGTATRDRKIEEARKAYMHDVTEARNAMALTSEQLTAKHIPYCRIALVTCAFHLDELARLIAERDGCAESQSIGPDVALNGWGSKR
jgi:hypothetical protein